MITVRLQGGLGNQMFQYALGRALSTRHTAPLRLDLSWFSTSKNRTYELDCFNIPHDVERVEKVGGIFNFLKQKKSVFVETTSGFNPRVFTLPDGTMLEGYWQSEKYFKDIEGIVRKEFTLKNGWGANAKKWADAITRGESVAIHVRRGDYLEQKHREILGVLSTDYYQKAAEIILSKTKEPIFFVFSDDMAWAKENVRLPSKTEFVSDKHITDAEEMILIGLCKHQIIANSSFSWWGAWLNRNREKIVIAPKNWFVDPTRVPKDLIPASWLQI